MMEESQKDAAGRKVDAYLPENAPVRIRIEQSVLNKDVSMRVMGNGLLFVQAPLSLAKDEVIRVIEKNRDWIRMRLVRLGLWPGDAPSWKPLTVVSLFKRFSPKIDDATVDWIIASMPWGEMLFKVKNCGEGTWMMQMSIEDDESVQLIVPKTFSVSEVVAFIKAQTANVRRGLEERRNKPLVDLPDWRPEPYEVLVIRSTESAKPLLAPVKPDDGKPDADKPAPEAPSPEAPRGVGPGPLPQSGLIEAKVMGRKVLIPFRKHNAQIFVSLRRLRSGKCVIHLPRVMTRAQLLHYISEHQEQVAEYLKKGDK